MRRNEFTLKDEHDRSSEDYQTRGDKVNDVKDTSGLKSKDTNLYLSGDNCHLKEGDDSDSNTSEKQDTFDSQIPKNNSQTRWYIQRPTGHSSGVLHQTVENNRVSYVPTGYESHPLHQTVDMRSNFNRT